VAATNQNMKALLADGRMREDFFYRIHIITITMPPLRSRRATLWSLNSSVTCCLSCSYFY